MNISSHPNRSKAPGSGQRGRTLIELLVAMTISLIIVAAVGSLYYFTSQSSRTAEQVSTTEERGRLALHYVGEPIALAGHGNINNGELSGAGRTQLLSFKGAHLRACTNGRFADPFNNDFTCVAPQNGAPGDALFIGYQAETVTAPAQGLGGLPMRDCLGQAAVPVTYEVNPVPAIFNVYSVEPSGSGVLEFGCRGGGNVARQGLIRNVENFKVYFALDGKSYQISPTGQQMPQSVPSRLMTATQINQLVGATEPPDSLGNPWNHVVAVYVCVLLSTTETGTTPDGISRYQPCPADETEAATGTVEVNVADGIARRSYTEVFTVRSRTQAHAGSKM